MDKEILFKALLQANLLIFNSYCNVIPMEELVKHMNNFNNEIILKLSNVEENNK